MAGLANIYIDGEKFVFVPGWTDIVTGVNEFGVTPGSSPKPGKDCKSGWVWAGLGAGSRRAAAPNALLSVVVMVGSSPSAMDWVKGTGLAKVWGGYMASAPKIDVAIIYFLEGIFFPIGLPPP
ncbi:MAG: hypothetical protein Fur0025_43180 [Oscillatoriaceae cyanobacterium]